MIDKAFTILGVACIVLFALVVISGTVWWSWYKYQDCVKVGHSKLYCIGRLVEGR